MTNETIYDAAVIGAGMFGSAAAKYLSKAGLRTLIIGSEEPQDWKQHQRVFGSHYDEARITRIVDPDPVWCALATRSIEQYPIIEEQSGIKFHYSVGCLRVAELLKNGESGQQKSIENGHANNAVFEVLSEQETVRQFPHFVFPKAIDSVWETGPAGLINPRKLVQAQLKIAQDQDMELVRQTVQEIIPEKKAVRIITREGQTYQARKVLVAAGAYTNFLLKHSHGLQIHPVQVILAEVEKPSGEMPCLIYDPINFPGLAEIYLLPPVCYPDGKWYLKIGAFSQPMQTAENETDLREWFQQEPSNEETRLTLEALQKIMPHLKALSYRAVPCVWTYTPQTQPLIEILKDEDEQGRIAVAVGGCGRAAKSSDAIGKLGAELLI